MPGGELIDLDLGQRTESGRQIPDNTGKAGKRPCDCAEAFQEIADSKSKAAFELSLAGTADTHDVRLNNDPAQSGQ